MDDLISRQAAIDAVDAIGHIATMPDGDKCVRRSAVKYTLSMLPSAQPKQRWIPCSERLPKKDGRYQVTRYDYVTNIEFIDILWYEKNLWWNGHSMGDYAVTAWMPLPEPYQEGETE